MHYYFLSAGLGNKDANNRVGDILSDGKYVKTDFDLAIKHYKTAAENGCDDAYCSLGSLSMFKRDYANAAKYYLISAEKGNCDSMLFLGLMHQYRLHPEWNAKETYKWYEKSSDGGNKEALLRLAEAHLLGEGVERDPDKAVKIVQNAIDEGVEGAEAAMRNFLETGLFF
jgi:TPR repeat protein